jgi:ABC-type transport system involved in cytochrome bd biosynthesis fused ATPase/permease subunit
MWVLTKDMGRYQFGILRLIVLTTATAAVLALVMRMHVPIALQLALACYFLLIVGWLIFRGPRVAQRLGQAASQRRRLQQEREELLQSARRDYDGRGTKDDE